MRVNAWWTWLSRHLLDIATVAVSACATMIAVAAAGDVMHGLYAYLPPLLIVGALIALIGVYVIWVSTSPAHRLMMFATDRGQGRDRDLILLHEDTETLLGLYRQRPTGLRSLFWEVAVVSKADAKVIMDADIMGQPLHPEQAPYELYRFAAGLPFVGHEALNMPGGQNKITFARRHSATALLNLLADAREFPGPGDELPDDWPAS